MGGNQGVSSRCVREAMRRVAVNVNGRRGPKLGTCPFTHLVGELLAHGHRRARELDDTSVPDERGHQGGHQRASKAIHGHQSSSELIRGHRRTPPLAAARPNEGGNQISSEAIGAPLPRLPRAQKVLRQKPETQSGREDRVQMPVDRELQGRVEPRRAVGL